MLIRTLFFLAIVLILLAIVGCAEAPSSTKAFVLPPGDPVAGEQVFLNRRCFDCHQIPGVSLPVAEQPGQVLVKLGGGVSKVKTYGDLLTAIVNPSHRLASGYAEFLVSTDGVSNMTNYNDVLTVTELTNLVAYLQSKYRLETPRPAQEYPIYPYY